MELALEPCIGWRPLGFEEHGREDLNYLEQTVSGNLHMEATASKSSKSNGEIVIGKWKKRKPYAVIFFFSLIW